jgi:hypothetical protein
VSGPSRGGAAAHVAAGTAARDDDGGGGRGDRGDRGDEPWERLRKVDEPWVPMVPQVKIEGLTIKHGEKYCFKMILASKNGDVTESWIYVYLKIGHASCYGHFIGETDDNALESEISYFQTTPYVKVEYWINTHVEQKLRSNTAYR